MDAATTCLLVVDVQPEYWSNCAEVRKDFPEFPANCSRAIAACRRAGVLVVHVRADYRAERSPWLAQFQRLNPDKPSVISCGAGGSTGAPLPLAWEPFAAPVAGEPLVPKPSWSAATGTPLLPFLKASGVEAALVLGLITSVCVQQSAFALFEAGLRVGLVSDACADRGRDRHDAAVLLYGNYMYEVLSAADMEDAAVLRPARGFNVAVVDENELDDGDGDGDSGTMSDTAVAAVLTPPVVLTAGNLRRLADGRRARVGAI
jgi:nicotinamidase-related amidase